MSIMPALKMSEFRKDFKSHIGNYDRIINYNDFRTLAFKDCTPKMDHYTMISALTQCWQKLEPNKLKNLLHC